MYEEMETNPLTRFDVGPGLCYSVTHFRSLKYRTLLFHVIVVNMEHHMLALF